MTHLSVAAVASQWLSAKAFTPARTPAGGAANDRWVSNFDQFFVGLPITVFELDGGRRFATPMDLLWQINYGEMLSGLMVITFLILLDASVVVVASMVMFPLIDLALNKKAKPAPRPAQVETWQQDGPTAHAQL